MMAKTAAKTLLDTGVCGLVSWGTAGALVPGLPVGTVLLPQAIKSAAGTLTTCDPWRSSLQSALGAAVKTKSDLMVHSASIIATPAAKTEQFHASGASATDMESAVIVETAQQYELPCIIIRAISDDASTNIPRLAMDNVDPYGRANLTALLAGLIGQPQLIPQLSRLGIGFRRAQRSLSRIVSVAGSGLAFPRDKLAS